MQVCNTCGVNKPLSAYYREPKTLLGVRLRCRECCKLASNRNWSLRRIKRETHSKLVSQVMAKWGRAPMADPKGAAHGC